MFFILCLLSTAEKTKIKKTETGFGQFFQSNNYQFIPALLPDTFADMLVLAASEGFFSLPAARSL